MFQSDVLMRQMQQAAQVIAQIMMLRKNGQVDEALELLQKAGETFFDLDFEDIATYTYEDVAARLIEEDEADHELLTVLSEMLRHLGELRALQEDWPAAYHSLQLALELELRLSSRLRTALPAGEDPVDAILQELDLYSLDPSLFPAIIEHYERMGRYADVENMLFFWADMADEEEVKDLSSTGWAFFQRLDNLSDQELARGDFSRREVNDGLQAFKQMMSSRYDRNARRE